MPSTTVTGPGGEKIKVNHPEGATREQIIAYAAANYKPGPGVGKTIAGLGAEVAIGESARLGGSAAGAAIGSAVPVVGTAIGAGVGYVIGGLGGGAAGSITRQRIQDPDGDISWGEVMADSFINLIPGSKAVKGGSAAIKAAKTAGKQAAYGAGISASGKVVEEAIDEKRLPTWEELTARGVTGAALGGALGLTGVAAEKLYRKYAGMKSRDFTAAITGGDKNAKVLVDGVQKTMQEQRDTVKQMYKAKLLKVNETFADEHAQALKLQKSSGGGQRTNKEGIFEVVSDETDYYMASRLANGRIQTKHKRIAEQERLDNEFLIQKGKESGVDPSALSSKVDNYLHARHALDYNKKLYDGAAGITDEVAKKRVLAFEKAGLHKDLEFSIDVRRQQSHQILDELVEGGLVKKSTALKWRKQSPEYVPLTRIMDESDASVIDSVKHLHVPRKEIKSTGVFGAKGDTELTVAPVRENIYNSLVAATKRAEKNKANIAFKKLLEHNKGNAEEIAKITHYNPRTDNKDTVLSVYEKGIRYSIKFEDPNVAAAFKGSNKEELPWLLKGFRALLRFRGKTLTLWNPLGFTVPNIVRDRSEAFVNALAKMNVKEAAKTLNPLQAGTDMWTVFSKISGRKPINDSEKALFKLYDDFKQHGGSTGGLALETIKDVEKEIQGLTRHLSSPLRRKAGQFNELLAKMNEVAEDSTRFGAYRQALASGMTKDQAALAARDSSFDPMLKGNSDILSAMYLFANPAVQSAKNFLRSMRNPKIASSVMAGLIGVSLTLDKWNSSYDPDWREKLKDSRGGRWKENKHLIIVTGTNEDGTLKYVSLPVGYSMVPFKIAADRLQQIVRGQDVGGLSDIALELGTEIMDSYNPTGGSVIPSVFAPITEITNNLDSLGRTIRPWDDVLADETEKVFPGTADTVGGEIAMSIAEAAKDMGYETSPENLIYLFEHYTGGTGKEVTRLMNVASKMFNGDRLEANDIPTLRRFYGKTWANTWEDRTGFENIQAIEKQEGTSSIKASRIASEIAYKLQKARNPSERQAILQTEIVGNPEINQAVIRSLESRIKNLALGITYTDKARQNLGVKNGARAFSYVQTFEEMDKSKIPEYVQDQRRKRILTPEVEEQIVSFQRFKTLFAQ